MIYNFKSSKQKDIFLKSIKSKKIDFLIIGSGFAGISLAFYLKRLSKFLRIVIVEKGKFLNKSQALSQKNKIFSSGIKIKDDSRVFGIGGSSNTWGGIISYFLNNEENKKWPISTFQLNKLTKEVAKDFKFEFPKKNTLSNERIFYKSNEPKILMIS